MVREVSLGDFEREMRARNGEEDVVQSVGAVFGRFGESGVEGVFEPSDVRVS